MEIVKNKSLKALNTFGFDIKAAEYAEFVTAADIRNIFRSAQSAKWYLLGGGSNTLFSGDFDGLVLHPAGDNITVEKETEDEVFVRAEAGVEWDHFVRWCLLRGYYGVENLSAIPGQVGSAPVQNIGAYGVEAKDVINSLNAYIIDKDEVIPMSNEDCRFGYRDSIFKNALAGKTIILNVLFRLSKKFKPNTSYGDLDLVMGRDGSFTADDLRGRIVEIRHRKLPDPARLGNGGSFFRNPVVTNDKAMALKELYPAMPTFPEGEDGMKIPAGWLIDKAGWKGNRKGHVGVYEHQALVLVNYGGATPNELIMYANDIVNDIKEKFGILLIPEINIV